MSLENHSEKSAAARVYIYCIGVFPTFFSGLVFKQAPYAMLACAIIALLAAVATRFYIIFSGSKLVSLLLLGQATVLAASYLAVIWRRTSLNGVAFLIAIPLLILFGWMSFHAWSENDI